MIVAILGRIPALGIAECERVYGNGAVMSFGAAAAKVDSDTFDVERFGSIVKAGRVVAELPAHDWREVSKKIVQAYSESWSGHEQKITLGISAYGFPRLSPRDIQKTGLVLKQKLKSSPGSLRLIPNDDAALSSATSHHNKLGLSGNKVELLIIHDRKSGTAIIAESVGAQNITALARRDQGRPKRDAFVGMLPPKLALTMVNLAHTDAPEARILDPFCGTGVILQEAALLGHRVYGTDLSEKMVDYSRVNIDWLADSHHRTIDATIEHGDAMTHNWRPPVDAVVCESYLGQPFSAPPSPAKLREVRGNCNRIISEYLKNIHRQLEPGTPLCVAIPAWRDVRGTFTHLPLINHLDELGFSEVKFKNIISSDLLYYREDQVVARELLVITAI